MVEDVYRRQRDAILAGVIHRTRNRRYEISNAQIKSLIDQYNLRHGLNLALYRPEFLRGISYHLSEMSGVNIDDIPEAGKSLILA